MLHQLRSEPNEANWKRVRSTPGIMNGQSESAKGGVLSLDVLSHTSEKENTKQANGIRDEMSD